jgi:signal peptidase I
MRALSFRPKRLIMKLENAASAPQSPAPQRISNKTDRRALIAVSLVGFILFLGVLACLPGTGFILRTYNIPSSSMLPTLRVGGYVVASRAAYGYSRYSFDWVRLPIEGRIPMLTPQRGDLVVFKLPRDGRTDYVKRIVGLPGDKVQMINGRLVINGQMVVREPIAKVKTEDFYGKQAEVPAYRESLREGESHTIIEIQGDAGYNDNTPLFDVPQGQYFVLGDNRDNSTDSRVAPENGGVGFVPLENLVGRVIASF